MCASENFQDKFNAFHGTFCYHYNCAFPITKIRIKTPNKWFTPEIKAMHSQLCEMKKLEKQLKNPNYTTRYKEFKSFYTQTICNHRANINNDRLAKTSNIIQKNWKIMNETRSCNIKNPPFKIKSNYDNKMITDITDIVNKFNDYFVSLTESCPKPKSENIIITNLEHNFFLFDTYNTY